MRIKLVKWIQSKLVARVGDDFEPDLYVPSQSKLKTTL